MRINLKLELHNLTQNEKLIEEGLALLNNDIILFNTEKNHYKIDFNDNVIFTKESKEVHLVYNFISDTISRNKAKLIEYNSLIFIDIITKKIEKKNGYIFIKYKKIINEEKEDNELIIKYEEVKK